MTTSTAGTVSAFASAHLQAAQQPHDRATSELEVTDAFTKMAAMEEASPLEKIVASAAADACSRGMSGVSKRRAQLLALQALAGGVSGPVGGVLASLAVQTMSSATDRKDGRTLGAAYLDAIGQHSPNPSEALLARTAREATRGRLWSDSGYRAQMEALQTIQAGLLPTAGDIAVGQFGRIAVGLAKDNEDARAMGSVILNQIVDSSKDAVRSELARTALDTANQWLAHEDARGTQMMALQMLGSDLTDRNATQVLADFGLQSAAAAVVPQDVATIAGKVVESLTNNPMVSAREQHIAAVVRGVAESGGSNKGLVLMAGLQALSQDSHARPEKVIADFGLAASRAVSDFKESRSVGDAVLRGLASSTEDADLRKAANKWRRKAARVPNLLQRLWSGDSDDVAMLIQRDGLQALSQQADRPDKKTEQRIQQEVQKMADALQPKPDKSPEVKVEDGTVIIGGIRIARQRTSPPLPAAAQDKDRTEA